MRKFLTYCLLFFAPLVLVILGMEGLVRKIPNAYKINEEIIAERADSIEVMVLGSSQMMSAVNPAWLKAPTLNLASGDQHHDTDFKLLKELLPKLPNVHTLVLEVSYSHLELPHNGPDFWKNNFYLKYYGVNCFERPTYFKDEMLFLSNPPLLSERVYAHYIQKENYSDYNIYGFNIKDSYGQFAKKNHDASLINQMKHFKINLEANLDIFQENSALLLDILTYLQQHNKKVILVTQPMYPTYLRKRNPAILKRRDSVLQLSEETYNNVHLFLKETDTLSYTIKDFWNHSHLSNEGAEVFSKQLNTYLNEH